MHFYGDSMNVLNNEILFKQNSKCSVSTVQFIGIGNPHMENCSKYLGSAAQLEPPTHRTAYKVYFTFLFFKVKINPE